MSIQFSLGTISLVELVAVPVTVADGSAIFHYDGKLTAVFDGIKDDTVIQWTQIEGLAVTYTSPLNEAEITFTSNDLDKKVFICCTNPGTDAEICARAEFYHFPVSWVDGKVIGNSISLGTLSNPDYPSAVDFTSRVHHGMLPVDNSLPGYSNAARFLGTMVKMEGVIDAYTESKLTNSANEEGEKSIVGYSLLQDDGTNINVLSTYSGYVPIVLGVGSSDLDEWFQIEMRRYGYTYDLIVPLPIETSPGISEVISPPIGGGTGGIKTLTTILSTISKSAHEDSVTLNNSNVGNLLNLTTVLQTKKSVPIDEDTVSVNTSTAAGGILSIVTSIQTAISVT